MLTYVALPYLVVSAPAIAMYLHHSRPHYAIDVSAFNDFELILVFLGTGAHLEPLWFIPMMIIFYLFAPVFKWLASHPKSYALFPVFLMVALYTGRAEYSIGPLQNFVFYLPVYFFGIIAAHFREKLMPFLAKNIVFITLLWTIPVLFPATAQNDMTIYISKYFFCLGVLGILYVFSLSRSSYLLGKLADMSFGIFFVHSYVVAFTHTSLTILHSLTAIGVFMAYFTLVVMVSACVVFCIQKMLGQYSRLVIGS